MPPIKLTHRQAFDLLHEWQQKRNLLQGGIVDSLGNNATVCGFIEGLDDVEMRIDNRAFAKEAANSGIVLRLDNTEFLFGEWPETPPKYDGDRLFRYEAFLILKFANGSKCELYMTNL